MQEYLLGITIIKGMKEIQEMIGNSEICMTKMCHGCRILKRLFTTYRQRQLCFRLCHTLSKPIV